MDATPAQQNGLAAMLMQYAPTVKRLVDQLKPLVDQPVIRFPFTMPLVRSAVIAAGASNVPLLASDFGNSLEWSFEVRKIKPSQDPAHTPRDWRLLVKDQTFNQDWGKTSAMVATLIDDNTGAWALDFPWIVRPKGGGLNIFIDNLDTVNPITVDIDFVGYLLIPRA